MPKRLRAVTIQWAAMLAALAALGTPAIANAFCGFYVAGAGESLYANATMVVLMRDGTHTVLSMQNNYQGPPDAFALVIPVPTVLSQDDVKILPKEVFTHVDTLSAPRLVEYWERDPCAVPPPGVELAASAPRAAGAASTGSVTVEAQFTVGEYEIVILSANDSSGLETWLHTNNYNVPNGASSVLAPYVAAGTKFFVAKVDSSKVTFQNGQAALSPLRFDYDTPDFTLPVRLGLLNSQGTQDLIVTILAPTRYEVANYPNVTIPTNIRVQDAVRTGFGDFYEALFSQVLDKNPGAVVTEYSWDSGSCDPCPTPPLTQSDLATLGADVTKGLTAQNPQYVNYTLTRLHYRYTKDSLGDDLVFKEAPALQGGRGVPDAKGMLDPTVTTQPDQPGYQNNFQGRYVILHPYTDPMTCASPVRGNWDEQSAAGSGTQSATNTALTGAPPKAANLSSLLAESLPSLGVTATQPMDPLKGAAGQGGTGGSGGSSSANAGGANASSAGSTAVGGTVQTSSGGSGPLTFPDAGPGTSTAPRKNANCACDISAARSQPSAAGLFALLGVLGLSAQRLRRRRVAGAGS